MSKILSSPSFTERLQTILASYLLPLGVIALFAGLPLLPDRSLYHKLFYGLVCAPAVILLLWQPKQVRALLHEPVFQMFLAFIAWLWLSLGWTQADEELASLAKWPLYVVLLFLALFQLQERAPKRLVLCLHLAAILVLAATLYAIIAYLPFYSPTYRMIGTGALSNPLLSSHLFGFFTVYWIVSALYGQVSRRVLLHGLAALIMLVAVAATGSRTPLIALTMVALWLCLLRPTARSLRLLIGAAIIVGTTLVLLAPDSFVERGLSYRPDIWHQAVQLIMQSPWIGHGYNTPIAITVETLNTTFREPHNFALGVLHDLGIVGFIPWLAMQGLVLWLGWRHRRDWRFVLVSAWMIYGLGAGLTEGGGILSRPKEHWFLLWIPLAMMAALSASERVKRANVSLRPLSQSALDRLCVGATVIEQDGLGPKVLKLTNGSFLKIFRRKQWLSSASLNPYGQRFARNSLALAERHIETPRVLDTWRLPDGATAVRYEPLPGQTMRQALIDAPDSDTRRRLVRSLGSFVGQMHEQGVYFRSLHLGNVLVLPNGQLALIDIADMRLFDAALNPGMRQRNLRHMQRYPQDRLWLFEEQREALMEGYALSASTQAARHLLSTP